MSKKIKMVLYGEPGVGKSVFASKAPKPFFICTDGNYEWLTDFGAKEEDHVQVNSWDEARKIFNQPFDDYETIVVDLVEDLFKWCEYEYCKRNRIEHLSDMGYGKAYDATRNEFFIEISKLLSKEKNVILIMHGIDVVVKDRRGIEQTKHIPTTRIPDKVLDMIEGRVRYFLRAYVKDIEKEDGTIKKERYISLIPKPNEYGIIRGVNEETTPQDILLNWEDFTKAINFTSEPIVKEEVKKESAKKSKKKIEEEAPTEITISEGTFVQTDIPLTEIPDKPIEEKLKEIYTTEPKKEIKEEPKKETVEQKPVSAEDKLAAIKAKLAKMKGEK